MTSTSTFFTKTPDRVKLAWMARTARSAVGGLIYRFIMSSIAAMAACESSGRRRIVTWTSPFHRLGGFPNCGAGGNMNRVCHDRTKHATGSRTSCHRIRRASAYRLAENTVLGSDAIRAHADRTTFTPPVRLDSVTLVGRRVARVRHGHRRRSVPLVVDAAGSS